MNNDYPDYGHYLGRHENDIIGVVEDKYLVSKPGWRIGNYFVWQHSINHDWRIADADEFLRWVGGIKSKGAAFVIARKLQAVRDAKQAPGNRHMPNGYWQDVVDQIINDYNSPIGYRCDREKGIVYTMYGYYRKQSKKTYPHCGEEL